MGYGLEVDIYSYGMVLYELLTLNAPFDGEDLRTISANNAPPMRPDVLSDSAYAPLVDIYQQCTNFDPLKRPSAFDLVGLIKTLR